jgi:hypothetical protein
MTSGGFCRMLVILFFVGFLQRVLYLIILQSLLCGSFRFAPNGPAIKGGCVTRREHRAESRYFSQKIVTVQGGYGALFAVMVQILLGITSVAVQF